MAITNRKVSYTEAEWADVTTQLKDMVSDPKFNTQRTYSANTEKYPDNLIPFVDKHIKYLATHPSINPHQYIANLQLMTKIR